MSGNDPKDTDSVETETVQGTSRRNFIAGSAVAVVGGTVAAIIPGGAKAGHHNEGGVHTKTDNNVAVPDPEHWKIDDGKFVAVILRAWESKLHKTDNYYDLLFVPSYQLTRNLLDEYGITGIPKPRVITQETFNNGYNQADVDEITYVLPNPPVSGNQTGATARDLMAAVPFGM